MTHSGAIVSARTSRRRRAFPCVALTGALTLAAFLPGGVRGQDPDQTRDVVKFHHQSTGAKVDYQALLEAATPLSASPEGLQLLGACLEAYGGAERLARLQGFRLSYSLAGSVDEDDGRILKSFARGRRYRVAQRDKERILNGDRCWVQDASQTWKMDDFRYRAELYSYLVLAMPAAAETERFDEVRYSPETDGSLGLFYFVKTDSLMLIMGVDTEDHLIKSTTGVLPNEGATMVFVNRFDDFREEDGYLFPHRLVNYSLGMKLGESVLEEVTVNPAFPADEFLPRTKGE